MKLQLTLIFFWVQVGLSYSQPLQVVSMSPSPQSLVATNDQTIELQFNLPLNPTTIDNASFLVSGRWSGPMSGQFSFASGNTVLKFIPDRNFIYGEWITVRLTSAIEEAGGEQLTHGFGANFWIKSLPASLDLDFVEEIDMRLPGEGALTCYGAYAGDVNNDDYSDLVVITEDSDDIRVMLNDNTGGYGPFEVIEMPPGQGPSTNEGADFNHDGYIDMAIGSTYSNTLNVLMGDQNSGFGNQTSYQTGEGVRGVAVADFDGDGWDDIITANRFDSNLSLLMNTGGGQFDPAVTIETGFVGETSIGATDLNGDGFTDLVVAMYDNSRVVSLLNDGAANFTVTSTALVGSGPWMLALGDVNGDGYADVATANRFTDDVSIVFSDGTGELQLDAHYQVNTFPVAIDLGDIDGDGDLDFISSNVLGGDYTLMENDGSGVFINPRTYPSADMSACAVIHDRNNDGALDITMIDEAADVVILYNNYSVLGDEDIGFQSELTLSPNPFQDQIRVEGIVSGPVSMELYDINGRLLFSENTGISKQFDLSPLNLITGMYIAQLYHNGLKQSFKLVKL